MPPVATILLQTNSSRASDWVLVQDQESAPDRQWPQPANRGRKLSKTSTRTAFARIRINQSPSNANECRPVCARGHNVRFRAQAAYCIEQLMSSSEISRVNSLYSGRHSHIKEKKSSGIPRIWGILTHSPSLYSDPVLPI